ncbi:MAG TPA: hypothetical protein VMC10_19260 [Stellaceae bacterium]|nr:hypothetical protein [Stellaceae bacterium]
MMPGQGRAHALRALGLCALLAVAGCSGTTAGTIVTSDPAVPTSPTVGEGPGAAYAVLSCSEIGQEERALAALTHPGNDVTQLAENRAALAGLAKTKGCVSLTGQLADPAPAPPR